MTCMLTQWQILAKLSWYVHYHNSIVTEYRDSDTTTIAQA